MKFDKLENYSVRIEDEEEELKFITVKGCKPETHRKLRTVAAALDVPMPHALDFCVSTGLAAVVDQINGTHNNKDQRRSIIGRSIRRISEQPT